MIAFRAILTTSLAMGLVFTCLGANAQDTNSAASIQQKLAAQYPITKTTDDRTDIVTAGAVLVLQKDHLLMYSIATPYPPLNIYKKGKISQSAGSGFLRDLAIVMTASANNASDIPQRKFQAGEKFWVTGVLMQNDGILFQFYSDPYDGIRYYGQLKFPFPRGQVPQTDEALKTIAEVLTVQPNDTAGGDTQPKPAGSSAAPAEATLAPIPPPPPPADAPPPPPKTISLGQTKDVVVAIFGQPTKVAKLGAKEIDYYPDMKVTFLHNKVTDVQ
jgi:hypothetical protein